MGVKFYPILAIFLLFAAANAANTTNSSHSVDAFLSSFNVSGATENALSYTNISYNGNSYLFAYYRGSPYLLINATSGYSFVMNPVSISSIITPTILQGSIAKINTTYLSNSLIAYNESSAGPLLDCIQETGLNQPNGTCTTSNYCASCRSVPVCSQVLSSVGYGSPFQQGISLLQSNFSHLVSNVSVYLSSVSQLKSTSTAQLGIVNLQNSFDNISVITQGMYQNPVFPPPPNTDYSQCANYGAVTGTFNPKSSDWFCAALGFCQFLTYNYTLLNNIQNYVGQISALPISQTQILSIAQGVSNNENGYASVIIASDELRQRNQILNTTLAGYNGIVTGVSSLTVSINNVSLGEKLSTLNANYTLLINTYTTANIMALNATLKKQYAALKALYLSLNTSYYSALKLSQNNTAMLLSLESESGTPQQQVVSLSFQEATLNNELASKPSNIGAIYANLTALNYAINNVPHTNSFTGEISRSLSGPLLSALLGPSSFSNGVKYAPIVATIPAIIISILILACIFLLYKRLNRRGRIRHARKTRRNWNVLFVLAILALLIYVAIAYSSAVTANSSASLADAASAIGSAKTVAVAINGTTNPYLASCESKIVAVLDKSKTVDQIKINGEACNNGSGVQTTDSCLGQYAASGVPVIILTNSSRNTLTAYSFYGTILSQSGNAQFTNSCLASLFLG